MSNEQDEKPTSTPPVPEGQMQVLNTEMNGPSGADAIDMAQQQIDYMNGQIERAYRDLEFRIENAPDSDKLRAAMRQDVDDRMAAVREQKAALERYLAQVTGVVNVISADQIAAGTITSEQLATSTRKAWDVDRLLPIPVSELKFAQRIHLPDAEVARAAHEINRAYCQALGDDTHLPWADAPDWQVQSAIKGVEFHRANKDATPEQSHENWLAEKQRDGWTYGAVKDVATRQHPCFLPYNQLPIEQRAKDYLFRACVHALS